MKLGFSSVACPGWDLATMVERAKEYGYQGIELRNLQGQTNLPLAAALSANPGKIGDLLRATEIELVCLSTPAAFHWRDPKVVAENQQQVREYVELASKLGCPFVRVFAGELPKRIFGNERREIVLGRVAEALRALAVHAAAHGVTILIENGGDFTDSAAMWYLADAADSPAVRACWCPFAALTRGERPTTSIPRLGSKIAMVRMADGKLAEGGGLEGYAALGQGSLETPRLVQLLRGMDFRGYLMVDWPKLWIPSLAEPEKVLPGAAAYLKKLLAEVPVVLTAYKGDKNAPRQGRVAATA